MYEIFLFGLKLLATTVYLDSNNLNGSVVSKPLPIGNLTWISEKELENWEQFCDQERKGCILEVDLEYP